MNEEEAPERTKRRHRRLETNQPTLTMPTPSKPEAIEDQTAICSAYDVHINQDLSDAVMPWDASLFRDGRCIANASGKTMMASIESLRCALLAIPEAWAKLAMGVLWPNH